MSSDENQWDLDDDSLPECGISLERCLFGKSEIQIPEAFIEQNAVFKDLMSLGTWENVLTEEQRQHLKKFLPNFPEADGTERQETIENIFGDENFKFGNPLKQFQTRLRDGFYSPDIAKYASLCRKVKFREYRYREQRRYSELLKEILMSKQRMFEQLKMLSPEEPLQFNYVPPVPKETLLENKVKKKYVRLLREVREECGVEDTSSEEEEEYSSPVQKSKKQLFKSLCPIPSPEPTIPSVVSTFSPRPFPLMNGDINNTEGNSTSEDDATSNSAKRDHPFSPVEVTEDDYKQMLHNHKRKKLDEEDFPELNTQNITLPDIMSRCQASKKITASSKSATSPSLGEPIASMVKKKLKRKDQSDRKVKKTKVAKKGDVSMQKIVSPAHSESSIEVQDGIVIKEEEAIPDFPLPESCPPKLAHPQYGSFFCLLRELITEFLDGKMSTVKLEEKVCEWQDSPTSSLNSWFGQQPSWVENVVSALKFLSGDLLGTQIENFVPFLDYKERAQHWRWIGVGRDADEQMTELCELWLQTKPESSTVGQESGTATPPPPKIRTSYVIRSTTDEEKDFFQEQEKSRFENPHKAFTYSMHGYDSVVGPVKGVYSKESAVTKAREHALLISTRPSYVTILTLVRDSAARLPNGEGTRSDICELLKDSQFLAPGVSDAQVNVVVSGALDRLHSEKDPCVKYDVNRKLWIYLHRNRSEEEFERIHQAQGAAVKAKKSLQKPKPIKTKVKDLTTTLPTAVTSSPALVSLPNTSNSDGLNNDDLLSQSQTSNHSQNTVSPVATPSPSKMVAESHVMGHVSPQGVVNPFSPRLVSSPVSATILKHLNTSVTGLQNVGQVMNSNITFAPNLMQGGVSATAKLVQQAARSSALAHNQSPTGVTESLTTPLTTITTTMQQKRPDITANKGLPIGQSVVRGMSQASQGIPSNMVITTRPETLLHRQASMGLISQAVPANMQTTLTSVAQAAVSATASHHTAAVSGASTANVSMAAANSDLVARLVQQVTGNQVVCNLMATQNVQSQVPKTTTIKIHGGNVVEAVSGGKPVRFSGKPFCQAKGQLVQIGGKVQQSRGVFQTPQGAMPTISIIPRRTAQGLVTVGQTRPSTTSTGEQHMTTSGSVVGSILQAGVVPSSSKSISSLIPIGSSGTSLLSKPGLQVISQPKVVSPSQGGGIVMTQLPSGSITLRPGGVPASNQVKVVTAKQAGLVSQLIAQQTPSRVRRVTADQIPRMAVTTVQQAGQPRSPVVVSCVGRKPGQNIQVVRRVLSQHTGLKPGQATILISQPTLHQAAATATVLPSGHIIQNPTKVQLKANEKGKAQPVYARIITPPLGMKLATVPGGVAVGGQTVVALPGQPASTQTISVIQTVGKLLQSSAGVCQPTTVTIGTPHVAGVEVKSLQSPAHINLGELRGDNLGQLHGETIGQSK